MMPATLITDPNCRLKFLPDLVGNNYFLAFERGVFNAMTEATDGRYTGGFWEFLRLETGGYVRVQTKEKQMMQSLNGWRGEMSADAAGICITLTILSHLSFKAHSDGRQAEMELISNHFHSLREWSYDHPEAEAIVAFCD